jgi:hypothetical protein
MAKVRLFFPSFLFSNNFSYSRMAQPPSPRLTACPTTHRPLCRRAHTTLTLASPLGSTCVQPRTRPTHRPRQHVCSKLSFFFFSLCYSRALTLLGTLDSDLCPSAPTVPPHTRHGDPTRHDTTTTRRGNNTSTHRHYDITPPHDAATIDPTTP